MKHLDLFSGIGGFALAAQWAWGEEYENVAFCDIEPFAQQILKKRFNDPKIYGDIRDIKGADLGPVDLLTGGFPCQPFSNAGKQEGKNDDRFLWPEMLRVIKESQPTWIIGENVAGIINMALDDVLSDLEGEGYETRTFVIPACAVNAPHRRDRVWIVAYTKHKRHVRGSSGSSSIRNGVLSNKQAGEEARCTVARCDEVNVANTSSKGLERGCKEQQGHTRQCYRNGCDKGADWSKNWLEVATEFCGVDDGIPVELDEFKLSKSRHRVDRLKGLGNAIVPQVVYEIMKSIKQL